MPTETDEQIFAIPQELKDVHSRNRPAGADGGTAVLRQAQDNRRPVESLADLAGGEADEPGIPAFACRDEDPILPEGGGFGDLRQGGGGDLPLHILPLAVHFLYFPRCIGGFFRHAGEQQPHRQGGVSEPAGSVQPGAEPESQGIGLQGARGTGKLQQRLQPGTSGFPDPFQTFPDDDPVLVHQGNHIRHGGDGGQIQPLFQPGGSLQCLTNLQRHAGTAQEGAGIVSDQGIQNGVRLRQRFRQLVVIRDDDGHAQFLCQGDFRPVRDATVHGDQELCLFADFPDCVFIQAVAVLLAGGQPEGNLGAQLCQGFQEDRGGADAVGVVVPEDHDPVSGGDSPADQLHRGFHSFHSIWIVQILQRGIQKVIRLFLRIHAPGTQQRTEPAGQCAQRRKVRGAARSEVHGGVSLF